MTNQRHTSGRQRANDRRPGLAPAVAAIGPPLSQIDGCRSVANIVKACAKRAGFDPNAFSGHSLRAGFLTSAAGKGASIFKMMDVSRHKSVDTLRGLRPRCGAVQGSCGGWITMIRRRLRCGR